MGTRSSRHNRGRKPLYKEKRLNLVTDYEQRNFLLSPAVKSLAPDSAESLSDDDSLDAFRDLRWGWTDGKPECRWCGALKIYVYSDGIMHRCAKCGRQFSLTTGTAFHRRVLPFNKIVHAVSLMVHEPSNPHRFGLSLGVQYKTAVSLAKKLMLVKGDNVSKTHEMKWPYLRQDPGNDAEHLLARVSRKVSREFPEQVRADVCQDLILGILSGDFSEDDLASQISAYKTRHYKAVENNKFSTLSFDQPVPGTDGMRWDEIIAAPPEYREVLLEEYAENEIREKRRAFNTYRRAHLPSKSLLKLDAKSSSPTED